MSATSSLSEDPTTDASLDASQGDSTLIDEADKFELLSYEHDLMVETFEDDVLFVMARGLGMERLFLNHLFLYSDPQLLVLVINTTPMDDMFFLERMNAAKLDCPAKLINSEMSVKDRCALYNTGGVQFVTSRILMVDLLNDRVPVANVTGIVVYRAHQLLTSFQESFILRLYREKKRDGFVKAFTDVPSAVADGIGQLQRLIDRLYVRRVRLVPRFDCDVKKCMEERAPRLLEFDVCLPASWRRVQSALIDVIRTCLRELKQSSMANANELDGDEETSSPMAALFETRLERGLRSMQAACTEKQLRLLGDLRQLRALLRQAEQLDPVTLYRSFAELRNDKEAVANNSGWLFTPTAGKIFAEVEKLCGVNDANEIVEPAKWSALKSVLQEIRTTLYGVLLFAGDEACCRQLGDLIKFGSSRLKWLLAKQLAVAMIQGQTKARRSREEKEEPGIEPWWNPEQVMLYAADGASAGSAQARAEFVTTMKQRQKAIARELQRKRRGGTTSIKSVMEARLAVKRSRRDTKGKGIADGQTRLTQFGIVAHAATSGKTNVEVDLNEAICIEDDDDDETGDVLVKTEPFDEDDGSGLPPQLDPLLLIRPIGERYNLMRQLDALKPNVIVMYDVDLATMRQVEMYKAVNNERPLRLYTLMYRESSEEERYLWSLRREFQAFELLIREQATLLIPRDFDVIREPAARLVLKQGTSTRDQGGRARGMGDDGVAPQCDRPKVIVDLREFNSALPSAIYRAGIDLQLATLEVGDYILSPSICVERKSHADLEQSLQSGRVFKQIDQMLQHYKNAVLLVEAPSRNAQLRRTAAGPFAGEMSRRCRETRASMARLIRTYPEMAIVWSLEPANSVELFQEIKLDAPNPDLTQAMAYRSDDLDGELERDKKSKEVDARILGFDSQSSSVTSSQASGADTIVEGISAATAAAAGSPIKSTTQKPLNSSIQRILKRLPLNAGGDVSRLMRSPAAGGCLMSLVTANRETLARCCDGNTVQADALYQFFNADLRLR